MNDDDLFPTGSIDVDAITWGEDLLFRAQRTPLDAFRSLRSLALASMACTLGQCRANAGAKGPRRPENAPD
jgi:hypothetical protein